MIHNLEETILTAEFHQISTDEAVAKLNSDLKRGLSYTEARSRLQQFGANKLRQQKSTPAWRRFLRQLADTLVILLVIAAAISLIIWCVERDEVLPYEAIVILSIVLLNALLAFVQEDRADKTLAALREMAAPEAKVVRDGGEQRIPSEKLVPGDLLLIAEGDTITADARLIDVVELKTIEASLTGESLPVRKSTAPIPGATVLGDRRNMIFSGTTVVYGHGRALVTATGMDTELGRIAGLLEQTNTEPTPLQRELDHTGKLLGAGVAVIAMVVVTSILLSERTLAGGVILKALLFGIALAVAAVPEGLAAIVTVVLAIGVQRMASRGAIVRKLPAVETLGSATVIASDKTGTLTCNEMTVRVIVTHAGRVEISGTGYIPQGEFHSNGAAVSEDHWTEVERLLEGSALDNNATLAQREDGWSITGDPTEAALLVVSKKAGLDRTKLEQQFPRVREIPFSADRKMMCTIHQDRKQAGVYVLWAKGAPDVLLEHCDFELNSGADPQHLTDARRTQLRNLNASLAKGR